MNIKNILLFLIFSWIGATGCNRNITGHKVTNHNITEYYDAINKAELFICSNQLDSALFHYGIAFDKKSAPFAIDIGNALTSAVMIKNYPVAQEYAQTLITKGCPLSFFTKRFIYKHFVDSKYFKQIELNYLKLI